MRITSTAMSDTVAWSLNQLRNRLARLQTDLATARRLHKASDHPAAVVEAMHVRGALERLDRYEGNLNDAVGWLASTDSALDQMAKIVQRARELAVQGANGTLPQNALDSLAAEVDKLLEGAVEAANTAYGEFYLFGGAQAANPPFVIDASQPDLVRYDGDTAAVWRDISPSTRIQINVSGDNLKAIGLFQALKNLADRLRAGDQTGISTLSLQELTVAEDGLIALRAGVGARHNQVEFMQQRLRDVRINLETHLDGLQGVDMERTMLDFNQADLAYRTALAVGARILPPSLVDFLR